MGYDQMTMMMRIATTVFGLMLSSSLFAASLDVDVKIIDGQSHDVVYTYVVPGSSTSSATANVNCYGVESVSCSGTAQASSSSTPASTVSYQVRGATLSLRLPDGRVAVVNCDSRLPPAGAVIAVALLGGKAMKPSNCSVPLVSQIKAEFSGNRAKLKWPVSIDGKKLESETYRILGVLEKP